MKDKLINAKVIFPTLGHTVLTTGKDVYRDSNVEVIVHVGTKASGYAYYEFYDVESGGEKYYAEGSLEIDGGILVGYDGVGSLPTVIMDILRDKLGVDVSECYDDDGQPNKYECYFDVEATIPLVTVPDPPPVTSLGFMTQEQINILKSSLKGAMKCIDCDKRCAEVYAQCERALVILDREANRAKLNSIQEL